MSKKWSKDSRKSQREVIQIHKPWEQSSGPISQEGKSRSSRNADKGKSPLRDMRKVISRLHKERLELLRWLEKQYRIKIKL